MGKENKKHFVVIDCGLRELNKAQVVTSLLARSVQGDLDAVKIYREMDAEEQFDNLIKNCDDDEYEFAT